MPVTQPTIIDLLDREWDELVRRGIADEALARWRRLKPAVDFATVGDLVAALADRDRDPESHNDILGALLELAPGDQPAARLVLHRFAPYLKRFVADHDPFDAEEWVALLVASAYEAICSYRAEDGPSRDGEPDSRDPSERPRRAGRSAPCRSRADRGPRRPRGGTERQPPRPVHVGGPPRLPRLGGAPSPRRPTHRGPGRTDARRGSQRGRPRCGRSRVRSHAAAASLASRAPSRGRAHVGGLRWTPAPRHPTDPP